ncbi:FGE-sulfatase domain-containing protein [Pseudomonas chlororaphis]|uniref:hypothetical protein n=1 Tax=Pseudomonas chlororaphis TaxID=587753 RepID=UPI0039E58153
MSEVKERQILFSGPMVRAILEGRKTVTRRAVKGGQIPTEDTAQEGRHRWSAVAQKHPRYGFCVFGETEEECARELAEFAPCPYGRPGDRLWVREAFGLQVRRYGGGTGEHIVYRATNPDAIYYRSAEGNEYPVRWKPSIHMPRHSSRILLEIAAVRVERLQDISDEQAKAEGCFFTDYGQQCFHGGTGWKDVGDCPAKVGHQQRNGWAWGKTTSHEQCLFTPRFAFANLWNATGGNWDANPWVWVVEFRRVEP